MTDSQKWSDRIGDIWNAAQDRAQKAIEAGNEPADEDMEVIRLCHDAWSARDGEGRLYFELWLQREG